MDKKDKGNNTRDGKNLCFFNYLDISGTRLATEKTTVNLQVEQVPVNSPAFFSASLPPFFLLLIFFLGSTDSYDLQTQNSSVHPLSSSQATFANLDIWNITAIYLPAEFYNKGHYRFYLLSVCCIWVHSPSCDIFGPNSSRNSLTGTVHCRVSGQQYTLKGVLPSCCQLPIGTP